MFREERKYLPFGLVRSSLLWCLMRRTIITAIAAAILVACAARSAHATDVGYSRKFGIGLELGDPTGLSAKLWVAPTNALDFGLGWWGFGVGNNCFRNGAN